MLKLEEPRLVNKETGWLQLFLNNFGIRDGKLLKVDNEFGPKTKGRLKDFQEDRMDYASGILDLETYSTMMGDITGFNGLFLSSAEVRLRQNILAAAEEFYDKRIPYIWGGKYIGDGTSQKSNNKYDGLDCSGATLESYQIAGHLFARKMRDSWTNAQKLFKTLPPTDTPLPGDTVYYGGKTATHVMIVTFNGFVIGEAGGGSKTTKPTPGACMQILPVDYRKDLIGFRSAA